MKFGSMNKLLQATVRDRNLYVTLERRTRFSAGRALTQSELAPEHANQTQLTMHLAMLNDARIMQTQTSWTVVNELIGMAFSVESMKNTGMLIIVPV